MRKVQRNFVLNLNFLSEFWKDINEKHNLQRQKNIIVQSKHDHFYQFEEYILATDLLRSR